MPPRRNDAATQDIGVIIARMAKKRTKGLRRGYRVGKSAVVMSVVLPKDAAGKEPILFTLLCEMDPDKTTLGEALNVLEVKTGMSASSIKRYAGPNDWLIKWKAHWDKKNGGAVTAQEVDTALQAILQRRDDMNNMTVPFSTIAGQLKGFAHLVVAANKDTTEVAATMMVFYSAKARRIMDRWKKSGGGLASVSKTDQALIEGYMKKSRTYYDMASEWMKPSAVIAMLDQVGMKDALGILPDGMDPSAFTVAALLKKMDKLAMTNGSSGLRSAIGDDELIEDIQAEILEDMKDIPEVNGRKVRDEENQFNMEPPPEMPERKKIKRKP